MRVQQFRVFPATESGGKEVAVFHGAGGDLQTLARDSGVPLSAFIDAADEVSVHLRVFTPSKPKSSSDSAAIAALNALKPGLDLVHVVMGGEDFPAQLCGGEWLLRQGAVQVSEVAADLSPIGLTADSAWLAQTERPNLVVEVSDLAALDAFTPDAEAIAAVNRATSSTGLVLYCLGGAGRADVSFRAFGPLKGFLEDAASSNMLACLVGVLGRLGRLPHDSNLIRAAQRMPGQLAKLTAQFEVLADGTTEVWVGGAATPV